MKGKVFIATTSFGQPDATPLEMLKATGLEVTLNPHGRKLSREEVVELVANSEGLVAGTEPLDAEVLKQLKNLKVISRCGTGMDNIDLAAARRQGIQVFNTPSPAMAVAELTVGLMLALLRHVSLSDRDIRAGKWQKRMGKLLQGKKVGIIGFGRIGQKVAELILGLGAQVIYYDPAVNKAKAGCTPMSLSELLSQSDIVSLHVSGEGSAPLLGDKELRQMKPSSWLINCARGGMVDEDALYQVLQEGQLAGAALDVFVAEPYNGPLAKLDNVILTPHIGSYAIESRVEMEVQAVKNLIVGLKG